MVNRSSKQGQSLARTECPADVNKRLWRAVKDTTVCQGPRSVALRLAELLQTNPPIDFSGMALLMNIHRRGSSHREQCCGVVSAPTARDDSECCFSEPWKRWQAAGLLCPVAFGRLCEKPGELSCCATPEQGISSPELLLQHPSCVTRSCLAVFCRATGSRRHIEYMGFV